MIIALLGGGLPSSLLGLLSRSFRRSALSFISIWNNSSGRKRGRCHQAYVSGIGTPDSGLSPVTQSCLTRCDPTDCSMPGLPVHHPLPEPTQTHVHQAGDAIPPSNPLSSPSSFGLVESGHPSISSSAVPISLWTSGVESRQEEETANSGSGGGGRGGVCPSLQGWIVRQDGGGHPNAHVLASWSC